MAEPTTPNQPIPPKESWSTGLLHGIKRKVLHARSKSQLSQSSEDTPTASTTSHGQYLYAPVQATPPISPQQFHQFQQPYPYSPAQPPPLRQAEIARFEGPLQQLPPLTGAAQTRQQGSSRLPMCFAVDVSGSTQGRVLQQEQAAIAQLGAALTAGTQFSRDKTHILPWDDRAQHRLRLSESTRLTSGAGTRPSVVLGDATHRRTLQDAGLWCLMTDGYIDEREVQTFANAIPRAGIHGTACVIVTFGYYQRSPIECNVSVGMSVFAVAPHCLFLYHCVQDGAVFVFQAKGCFTALLPPDKRFVAFDASTQWRDLHRLSYAEVAKVQVPQPVRLSEEAVVLPSGKVFDLRSIYENSVSRQDQLELLADYASLDVVVLAAKTRGKGDLVRRWIEEAQEANKETSEPVELEDVDGEGVKQLRHLVSLMTSPEDPDAFWDMLRSEGGSSTPELETLRRHLRARHQVNWDAYAAKVHAEAELSSRMNEVFDDVLTAIAESRPDHASPTPAALTPMSSPTPAISLFGQHGSDTGMADAYSPSPAAPTSPNMPRLSPLSPMVNHPSPMMSPPLQPPRSYGMPSSSGFGVAGSYRTGAPPPTQPISPPPHPRPRSPLETKFLPEFNYSPIPSPRQGVSTCLLCGRASPQTLLLRSTSPDEPTRNLPGPNARSSHRYPLVLGSYAETDVVLPMVSCDACAFLLLRAGDLPNGGGRVTAALPLVSLHHPSNRDRWTSTLASLYEHRFSDRIVLLVFLSSLCSTLEDIAEAGDDNEGTSHVRRCIESCCLELARLPGVSALAGLTPVGTPLSGTAVDQRTPVQDAIRVAFSRSRAKPAAAELPLLAYPIHGFVALVRLASLCEGVGVQDMELFVWKRLCHFLVEQHAAAQARLGVDDANARLEAFLFDGSVTQTATLVDGRTARSAYKISELVGTHLLTPNALDQFSRMGDLFGAIVRGGSALEHALAVFLHVLNEGLRNGTRVSDAAEFFIQLRYRVDRLVLRDPSLNDVLEEPALTDGGRAARAVVLCYRLDDTSE